TVCLAWQPPGRDAEALAQALRRREPPIVARVNEGRVLFDFRTLFESDLPDFVAALEALK
ncbi:MAG: hypothetical protein HY423_16345, partial [Candidatus Lambdaproteobacteria bacterium]|nr:hypothetical protein [Candidatus Lambdaproteobacteria bacterium]